MPDVSIVISGEDMLDDGFCGEVLVRSQHHHVFEGLIHHHVVRDELTQVVAVEERSCECTELGDVPVVFIGPEESLLDGLEFVVGQVLGIDTIADDEQLDILEQTMIAPKRMVLIPVDLVEGFLNLEPGSLEFNLHQGKAIDQEGDIVAIFVGTLLLDLVSDLVPVEGPVFLVKKADIKGSAIFFGQVKAISQGLGLFKDIAFGQVIENGIEFLRREF